MIETKCPNCGAPRQAFASQKCEYCQTLFVAMTPAREIVRIYDPKFTGSTSSGRLFSEDYGARLLEYIPYR